MNKIIFLLLFTFPFLNTVKSESTKVLINTDVDYCTDFNYHSSSGFSISAPDCYFENKSNLQRQLIQKANSFFALDYTIRTLLEQQARQDVTDVSVDQVSFNVTDEFTVKLVGNNTGNIRAYVGGFSFNGHIKFEKGAWLNAYVHFNANDVWLVGDYDINTGKVSNLQDSNVNINVSTDIDSALGFVPGLDALIEDGIKKLTKYEELKQGLYDTINAKLAGEYQLFGLNDVFSPGLYVYYGYDVGALLQDGIADLISGETLEIKIGRLNPYSYIGYQFYLYEVEGVFVNINFSDRLFINNKSRRTSIYRIIGGNCDGSTDCIPEF